MDESAIPPSGPLPEPKTTEPASAPAPTPPAPEPPAEPAPEPTPPAAEPTPSQPEQPTSPPPASPQVVVAHHGAGGGGGRRWLKILLILVLVALLAGAGWYVYQQQKDKTKKPAATAHSKSIDKLRVGIVQADFGKLYPDMSASEYGYIVNSQMFEGLVRYEGTNKIAPDLASTWTNPDDKTWLFTITPGVKFHDGNTLTAKDVKYSLDKVIASGSDLAQIFGSTIDKVAVVSDSQVKITTKDPDPVLLNRLAFLYIIDSNLPAGKEPSQAGTGPYMIKLGTKPVSNSVQMVAFSGYHGGQPQTKALDFGSQPKESQMVADFNQGKYDIVGPVTAADADKAANVFKFISSEPNVDYIGFNTVSPGPLQNPKVRQAIRYAVNGQAIGEAATGNKVSSISQVIPPAIPGYDPSITPYQQNTAKAKQLLAQAGYPKGLTLTVSNSDNSPGVDVLVKELQAAGITVKVDHHADFGEYIDFFSTGKAQAFTVNYASDTLDGLDVDSTVFSSANYSSPAFTKLLGQVAATTDPAQRLKLLQQGEKIIDQDVAVVPLYSEQDVWLMNRDYALKQDMPSSLISVYFYKAHQK